jgi:hypothetical protein
VHSEHEHAQAPVVECWGCGRTGRWVHPSISSESRFCSAECAARAEDDQRLFREIEEQRLAEEKVAWGFVLEEHQAYEREQRRMVSLDAMIAGEHADLDWYAGEDADSS